MVSDYRAAKYLTRMAERAETRAQLLRQKALATRDIAEKTRLEGEADYEAQKAREIRARVEAMGKGE